MKNPTFEVNFIVATLDPYSEGQSSMSTCSIPAKVTPSNNEQVNLTMEDQQLMLNENWDDTNMDKEVTDTSARRKKSAFQEILARSKQKNKGCSEDNRISSRKENLKTTEDIFINGQLLRNNDDPDCVPCSPESPKTKRAKLVFGRCFESTFSKNCLGEILAPNSDSE